MKDIFIKGNIRYSWISVELHWNYKANDLTLTKDKDKRNIPIAAFLRDKLEPYLQHNGFVFSFRNGRRPITANRLREWYYTVLEKIGISSYEREKRNITFHSSRRFADTLWRLSGFPDAVLQRFTNHDTDDMTESYTDYLPTDMKYISEAQERFIKNKTM